MTPRLRMLAAINHQPLDRIPTDFWATPEVFEKLQAHFGPGVDIRDPLGIDGFAGTGPTYIGPAVPTHTDGTTENMWGMRHTKVHYGAGTYNEQIFWPLAHARTIDDLEKFRWPTADWYDYSTMHADVLPRHAKRAVQCGYMAPFLLHNLLRGLELSLMDPFEDPEFTHHLINRICDFYYDHHRRMFEACKGLIDVAQVTDDLGTQSGPMISLETYNTFYRPHHQRFIKLCREFNIKVFHHDDGAIRPFIPGLIDDGIDILNPIQWRCPGMEVTALKKDFGHKLCFHGGVDNQETLPHGTPDQVRAEVRHLIDTLASDKTGFILAPCHNFQAITPIENILAMYDEARTYGTF